MFVWNGTLCQSVDAAKTESQQDQHTSRHRMLRRCVAASRSLRRPAPLRHSSTSTTATSTQSPHSSSSAFAFESLIAAPTTTEQLALRLQQYFDNNDLNAVSPTLRHQIVHSSEFVHKLSPLLQWAFHNLQVAPASASDESTLSEELPRDAVATLFMLMTPWVNIAHDKMWRNFYIRQFFLSHAPLEAFLAVYEIHESVLPEPRRNREKEAAFLAADLVQEFCARGRFPEAIKAYAQLPLANRARRDIVALVQDHEQFASLVHLYRAHRVLESPAAPLDPFPLLNALNVLKRHDELYREFQKLSPEEQGREDIQQLMG